MTYRDPAVATLLAADFVLARIDCAAQRATARAYQIFWNPTLVIVQQHGLRLREIAGYLPPRLLAPELLVALGLHEIRRGRPGQAIDRFARVLAEYPDTPEAPEALYWLGMAESWHYEDKARLHTAWQRLATRYPESLWAAKTMLRDNG